MTFLSIAPYLTAFCVVMCVLLSIRSKRNKYYKCIKHYKARYKHQTMNLNVLIETCKAIGNDGFRWTEKNLLDGDNVHCPILWYRITKPCNLDKMGWFYFERHEDYIIDIPWFSSVLFRRWENGYSKRRKEARQEIARCKNSTNDVLQDIHKKLEATIQKNCEQMKKAAIQQEQIFHRLSEQQKRDFIMNFAKQTCEKAV